VDFLELFSGRIRTESDGIFGTGGFPCIAQSRNQVGSVASGVEQGSEDRVNGAGGWNHLDFVQISFTVVIIVGVLDVIRLG